MEWKMATAGSSALIANPRGGYALEVRPFGPVWKWAVYAGGVAYSRGQSETRESAKDAAEAEFISWTVPKRKGA